MPGYLRIHGCHLDNARTFLPGCKYIVNLDASLVTWPAFLGTAVVSYLIGSIATAIMVARITGLPDPRTAGSGNPGATNVLRLGGKKAAIMTLVGDVLKGVLPIAILRLIGAPDQLLATAGLFVFIGHLYPVFFGFRGGKGVATAAGALLVLAPWVGLIALGTWLAVALITRYSSLAALTAAVVAAAAATWLSPPVIALAASLMSLGLIWRHRKNIGRLIDGSESRIGQKSKTDAGDPPSESGQQP